jgi:hypothetical protein
MKMSLSIPACMAWLCMTLASTLHAQTSDTETVALNEAFSEVELQRGKKIAESECRQLANAAWVSHAYGTECIRYYPSGGLKEAVAETPGAKTAVLFFHGDYLNGLFVLGNYDQITPQKLLDGVQRNYAQYKVPYILVARPGVYGSSGAHRQRRRPKEFHSLNAAVDAIKARYGLDQVVMAGQSGGSTAVAALLTLGRSDVKCAVTGSGNYSVNELAMIKIQKAGGTPRRGCDGTGYCDAYDVIEHVDGIAHDPQRQIVMLGDPQDQNTVFSQQRKFFEKVQQAGHAVTLIEAEGRGPERHSMSYLAYKVAGACARDQKFVVPAYPQPVAN